jgi:NADH-quinone oxidoreductase subunit I
MAMNDKDVRWVEEPRVGLWESTFLPAVVEGLKTTVKHVLAHKPMTQEFPEVKPDLPANYRGVHRLNRDEQGRVKCVACFMCATACPAHCIYITAAEAPPEWPDRDKFPASFVIDELKCIFCGMCEEACPCDAIELTTEFDISGLSREDMLFDREKLLGVYDETKNSPKDPPRTHRGALSGASEIDVPPASPTRPIGAPAVDALTSQPAAKAVDPAGTKLVPPGPEPGEPTHMHRKGRA